MEEYFVEEKSSFDKIMDVLVFLAVFVVTIFLITELLGFSQASDIDPVAVNNVYFYVNIGVFAIFVIDLIRLWKKSENAKDFFTHNWLDVLATIPFELIAYFVASIPAESAAQVGILKWFRFAKLTRMGQMQKISRVSKITKEFKAASHLKKEGEEYQRKHRL